jgi:hypothetical protein
MITNTHTQGSSHDVEMAIVPVEVHYYPRAADFLVRSSTQLIRRTRALSNSLTLVKVLKLSVGATVGVLSLLAAWWALDLAMWTSVKDFREDCRDHLEAFNWTTPACRDVLKRPLRPPPTWRDYLDKVAPGTKRRRLVDERTTEAYDERLDNVDKRWNVGHYVDRVANDYDELYQGEDQSPRPYLASKSGRRGAPAFDDEPELVQSGVDEATLRRRNAAYMYRTVASTGAEVPFPFPQYPAQQDAYDDLWYYFVENTGCDLWLNATSSGSIQNLQLFPFPDQLQDPNGFEETLLSMPQETRIAWREGCTYPPQTSVRYGHPRGMRVLWQSIPAVDIQAALAITFFCVAMGHEVIYGGFARRTRWKWQ